jgi:ATP/maltotriose-dependent transcriptional regulator MalT
MHSGRLDESESANRRAIAIMKTVGDEPHRAIWTCNLASVLLERGDVGGAEATLLELRESVADADGRSSRARIALLLAEVAARCRDMTRAIDEQRTALREYIAHRDLRNARDTLATLVAWLEAAGDHDGAREAEKLVAAFAARST